MEFEWDIHNRDKNRQKHEVSPEEVEEVFGKGLFLGPVLFDSEERFAVIGPTKKQRMLFVVYTLRMGKIRVISARDASRKERKGYEEKIKATKNSSPV